MISDKILLVQPRHNYAPSPQSSKFGHIYMPTSLFTIAAILDKIGVQVEIIDENIKEVQFNQNIVGLNLLGAPYIPKAIEFEKGLFEKFGDNFHLLIGGQVVSGLTPTDFSKLFSKNVFNGNLIKTISQVFGVEESKIPIQENVSLIPIYEKIGDEALKLYLSREFGFYLSQGCKHTCSFCAAQRTITVGENKKLISEKYRNLAVALVDFEFLVKKAVMFSINSLDIYLSNLDLFQNPLMLLSFAEGVINIRNKYPLIEIRLRGLSTSLSFLSAHRHSAFVIEKMVEAGLVQIGFGIDGATPKVYKETRKPQKVADSLATIEICREAYNLTPETLMVFGHNDIEDEEALSLAVKFCNDMQRDFGAVPRPHIAKDIVPGNDGWLNPKNDAIRQEFYDNPMLFQNLDFTAIPSPITHPDSEFRKLVTKYYKLVCELPKSLTQYVLAELPTMTKDELAIVKAFNQGRYDI